MMLADRLHRPCTCGTLRLFRGSPKIRQGMSLHTLRKHGLPQACERGVNRVLGLIPGRMRMIDIEPRHLGNHVLGVLLPFFGVFRRAIGSAPASVGAARGDLHRTTSVRTVWHRITKK